jgi:DNA-binding LacI/PurR family transcriptional regulator
MATKATVKLADVAREAGVSKGTASNVFSRPEVVRGEVREHVLATAKAMGYGGPSVQGRLLRAGKVNAIGVAAVEPMAYFFEDPWARALMAEISAVCDASGTGMALVSAKNQQKLVWNIQSALVDGFILLCVEGGEKLVELTRERHLPFVALALGVDDKSIPTIGIDNVAGASMAARHLAELGHRRFAVLGTEFYEGGGAGLLTGEQVRNAAFSTSRDRAFGYWQTLAEFGVAPESMPVYETQDVASIRTAVAAIFAAPQPPTAILAMSDRVALVAMEWLIEHGVRVPEDVSIVGFDGVREAELSNPALTTIVQPLAEIARQAVQAILQDAVPVERRSLPLTLAVRASTAAPKG